MTRSDRPMIDSGADASGLEAFFAAARETAPAPSSELMARIVADAEAELAARERPQAPMPRATGWRRLMGALRAIGGVPALAGMVTATVAGVWLGFATPDSLNTLSGGLLLTDTTTATSYDLEDMLPGYASFTGLEEEVQG